MNKKKNMRRMAGAMAVVVAAGAAGTCGYQRSAITAKAAEVDTEKLEQVAETRCPPRVMIQKKQEQQRKNLYM